MTPLSDFDDDRRTALTASVSSRAPDADVAARVAALEAAVEAQGRQLDRLRRSLRAVGRHTGVAVGGPCPDCDCGMLVGRNGRLDCTDCGRSRYLD